LEDGSDLKIGTPLVEGAYAEVKIVAHKKGDKQIIFKKKAKKRYQRTHGYRKEITVVEVLEIHASGGKAPILKAEKAEAPKPVAKKPAAKKPAAKKSSPAKEEA
jgi:large subunit ribosomal protein L21